MGSSDCSSSCSGLPPERDRIDLGGSQTIAGRSAAAMPSLEASVSRSPGVSSSSGSLFSAVSAYQKYNKYNELRELARGSFGVAVLLRCPTSGEYVVSKQINSQFLGDDQLKAVESEVTILSSLSHPNVIKYLCSYHRQEPPEALCIVTAYADGGTLEQAVMRQLSNSQNSGGPPTFPRNQVLTWAAQLTSALAHVHERNILHRDLKASNVFLGGIDRDILLGDFGLSRTFGEQSNLASTLVGTPYYLSPEQVRGEKYGMPADLWALGVIFFELLTLRRPFEAPNLAALALRISSAKCLDDAQLAQAAAEHPAGLRALVGRNRNLFALEPKRRLRMHGLVKKLQELCKGLTVESLLVTAEVASMAAVGMEGSMGASDDTVKGASSDTDTHLSRSTGEAMSHHMLAPIPAEVPELPKSFRPRADLKQLKERIVSQAGSVTPFSGEKGTPNQRQRRHNATTTVGMGGVGKTLAAAALCHDTEVGGSFECICWVSVGQDPDLLHLQNVLHRQLTKTYLPQTATDPTMAHEALLEAAAGKSVLCVLDDVWDANHAKHLSCIDADAGSSLVVTTRLRQLIPDAVELQCEVLSQEEALSLLLHEGGCEQLLEDPPPAALRAVELCGRLPLALGIAGGVIVELADSWQEDLIPLLEEEFGEGSIEERVVAASLRAVPEAMRAGIEELFGLLAVFPEDTAVPVSAIDVIAPLLGSQGGKRQMRRWLQQLLKANLMRGSVEHGVSVHDLVRDCMTRRAEARKGGLCALQREVVPLLLAAFGAGRSPAAYVSKSLHWHVRQAVQPGVAIHNDEILMRALGHEDESIRSQVARGLNGGLQAAIDSCLSAALWLQAAQLLWAAAAIQGGAAGAELVQAYEALEKLRDGETLASRRLEMRILTAMSVVTQGGYPKGSEKYLGAMERLAELTKASDDDIFTKAVGEATSCFMGPGGFYGLEGGTGKAEFVHTTGELLEQAHGQVQKFMGLLDKAASAAPARGHWLTAKSYRLFFGLVFSRQHRLPGFKWEERFPSRQALIDVLNSNESASHHAVSKSVGVKVDFMLFAPQAVALLLRHGDVTTVQSKCMPQLLLGWQSVAKNVREGTAAWPSLFFETSFCRMWGLVTPLLLNDLDLLGRLQEHTLHGILLRDDEALQAFKKMHGGSRPPDEEGFCMYTPETHYLHVRCIGALLDGNMEELSASMVSEQQQAAASTAALKAWLPSAEKLLHIAKYERYWDIHMTGPAHPTMLAATLHGTRLGDWATAATIARGLLEIKVDVPMHPLLRIEALRLLSRSIVNGLMEESYGEAWSSLEQAITESQEVGYLWMEVLALRDMLSLQGGPAAAEEPKAAATRKRYDDTLSKLDASRSDLEVVLGGV